MNKCTATTKKGTACKAAPLTGTDRCLAHSDAETRSSLQFVGGGPGSGRPPLPKPTEVARRLVEQNIVAVQRPYWRTLGFDVEIGPDGPYLVKLDEGGAKLHGTRQGTGQVVVSDHDDLGAMMTAAEKLQDRVFGRPKQATEISGPDGGAIPTTVVTDPKIAAGARALLRDAAATSRD